MPGLRSGGGRTMQLCLPPCCVSCGNATFYHAGVLPSVRHGGRSAAQGMPCSLQCVCACPALQGRGRHRSIYDQQPKVPRAGRLGAQAGWSSFLPLYPYGLIMQFSEHLTVMDVAASTSSTESLNTG